LAAGLAGCNVILECGLFLVPYLTKESAQSGHEAARSKPWRKCSSSERASANGICASTWTGSWCWPGRRMWRARLGRIECEREGTLRDADLGQH
jgi:hypothetical protein